MQASGQLVDDRGRKYLTADERRRFIRAAVHVRKPVDQTFVLTIAHTGARVSEVLALRALDVDLDAGVVRIRTLKRRVEHWREVPLPAAHARDLEMVHYLREASPRRVKRAALEILAGDGAPEGSRGHAHGQDRGPAGLPEGPSPRVRDRGRDGGGTAPDDRGGPGARRYRDDGDLHDRGGCRGAGVPSEDVECRRLLAERMVAAGAELAAMACAGRR